MDYDISSQERNIHLEEWGTGRAAAACGFESSNLFESSRTQHAESVTCTKCRRWMIAQWKMWAEVDYYERLEREELRREPETVTHWGTNGFSESPRAACWQQIGDDVLSTSSYAEFISCALCQHVLLSKWAGREAEEYQCAFCSGVTRSWWRKPEKCGHCKRPFLDVKDDPEFVGSVHNVIATIRSHVLRYRERYGPGSSLALDMDHVCSWLTHTIGEEWQDEDRVYLPSEQQLDTRIDGCTERREAA